jgi:hypothetical protein
MKNVARYLILENYANIIQSELYPEMRTAKKTTFPTRILNIKIGHDKST